MDSQQSIGTMIASNSHAGAGRVELELVAGRTVVTRCRANSPLRLLTPRNGAPAARVIAGSYGGGFLGGDAIDLTIAAGMGTRCLLGTQASTKIYRSEGAGCSQRLNVSAADQSLILSLPDPVVCFAGSRFSQFQRFDLSRGASLLMVDWFTSGRAARGERWAMQHYANRSEILVEGDCVFRDSLELDPADGEIGGAQRMGLVDCFATAVFVGPAIAEYGKAVVAAVQKQPIAPGNALLLGASELPAASVLRVAGKSTEAVGRWLRTRLAFVPALLGFDPWNRKW
jgi:urease accessory protein